MLLGPASEEERAFGFVRFEEIVPSQRLQGKSRFKRGFVTEQDQNDLQVNLEAQ